MKTIFLILCSSTVWPNYFIPTIEQWKSFEHVAKSLNPDLHKKIVKKRLINANSKLT